MSSSPTWLPISPSFGGQGHHLGYYHNIAHYLIIVPFVFLIVVAIGYNVAVVFATKWMYKNAWREKSSEHTDSSEKPVLPKSNICEEIYVVNLKIANYLLGDAIALKEENGYLVLRIHDYDVYMPLAMLLVQISEIAVAMTLVVLFFDFLVLQVTHICDPSHTGVDCYPFSETNKSATPLPCNNPNLMEELNVTNVICFHLSLNPVIAAAITGGFLKVIPHLLFTALTYFYLKYLKVKHFFSFNRKASIISHIVFAILFEIGFLALGFIVVIVMVCVPAISSISIQTANPMRQLTIIFCFLMYFLMVVFLCSIYPQSKSAIRFISAIYKQRLISGSNEANGKKYGSEKLRPWVVVDRSLSTDEYLLN